MSGTARPGDGDRDVDCRFAAVADRLFGVAYRMTGSVADAEDCVQEAYLRWSTVDLEAVDHDEAYLVRVVTRLAIDRQRRAARRRETYVGPWLPEPLLGPVGSAGAPVSDPERAAELADSLSFAFLVLLDRLSPAERAAFILHDVFGVPFDEVAGALDRTDEACRQLASRARRKLRSEAPEAPAATPSEPVAALLAAFLAGDAETCVRLLAPDVVLVSDAGPDRRAARRHVVGADRVLRLVSNLFARSAGQVRGLRPVEVNGGVGLLVDHEDGPLVITGTTDGDGRVRHIWIQMNPAKLSRSERHGPPAR